MYFLSVLHADPSKKVHLSSPSSFFISALSSPFGSFHLCGISSAHLLSFTCTSSCCHLSIISVHFCSPSAAASTHNQFCTVSRLGTFFDLSTLLLFFHFLSTFAAKNFTSLSFASSHQPLLIHFTFSFLSFLFFFFLHFFSFRFFRTCHLSSGSSKVLGSFPKLFALGVLRSPPWLFFFFTKTPLNLFPFTSPPVQHLLPHPWDVDLGNLIMVFFAHALLYLTSLLTNPRSSGNQGTRDWVQEVSSCSSPSAPLRSVLSERRKKKTLTTHVPGMELLRPDLSQDASVRKRALRTVHTSLCRRILELSHARAKYRERT